MAPKGTLGDPAGVTVGTSDKTGGMPMPHAAYYGLSILCPWPGCGFRIALVDFRLEMGGNPGLSARAVSSWGRDPDFGLVGRCPGCGQYVLFGAGIKRPIEDPSGTGLPLLSDDWHLLALIL